MKQLRVSAARMGAPLRNLDSWAIALASAVGLRAAFPLATGLFHAVRPLAHFRDRAIGVTTVQGVDASGYAHTWINLHLTFVAVTLAVAVLAAFAGRRWPLGEAEGRGVAILSELAIALMMLDLVVDDRSLAGLVNLLFAGVASIFFYRLLYPFVADAGLRDVNAALGLLLLPLPLLVLIALVLDSPLVFAPTTWIAFGALLFVAYQLARRTDASRLLAAGVPLFAIPLSLPLVNEVQYRIPSISPRALALVVASALLVLSVWRFWRQPSRDAGFWLRNAVFPLILASLALFAVHRPVLHLDSLDTFHLGERTLPTQQLVEFGKVPLMDLRPVHTFSDMAYPLLYTLLNGYRGLDMLAWNSWIPPVLGLLAIYFFLARVATPGFAFLASANLPVLGLVPDYYGFVLLPPIFLHAALVCPSRSRWLALWISNLFLLLWRLDFGLIGLLASGAVVGAHLLRDRELPWKTVASTAAIAAALAVAGLGVLALWAERPALEAMATFVHSYTVRLTTRTRAEIFRQLDVRVIFQYYLLPAVSWITIVAFAVRVLRRRRLDPRRSMLAFVAMVSLIISTRSLERHSLVEHFNPYLFVFLWACLPFFLGRRQLGRQVFLGVTVVFAAVALPPLGNDGPFVPIRHVGSGAGALFELHRWVGDEPRVVVDLKRHRAVVDFLRGHLGVDQTFFDFSNAPLLYLLTDREFPTYLIPNLEHNSESTQRQVLADLGSYHRAGRLPFVIFQQGDPFWDASDGFANEIRCYRIAEWIYQRYAPAVELDGYRVWAQKGIERADLIPESVVHDVALRDAPRLNQMARIGDGLRFAGRGPDPQISQVLDLPVLDSGLRRRLELDIDSSTSGELQVFFTDEPGVFEEASSVRIEIEAGDRSLVTAPVAMDPLRPLADVRFDPPEGSVFELRGARLVESSVGTLLDAWRLTQHFELRRLPWVWANLDSLQALERTAVVAVLANDEHVVAPGETWRLPLPHGVDHADAGYLHLRLRPLLPTAEPPTVTVAYGSPSSSLRFEAVIEEGRTTVRHAEPGSQTPVLHQATLDRESGRWRLVAGTEDPYAHAFLELDRLPDLDPARTYHLRATVVSSRIGDLQIFFSLDGEHFDKSDAVTVAIDRPGEPQLIVVPLPARPARRWSDVRFDPPEGSTLLFTDPELVGLPFENYLVRLRSQWRWLAGPVDELAVSASAPVAVERVVLRSAD